MCHEQDRRTATANPREEGLLPSMGSVAYAYDNSDLAESFVSTLKRELIHRHSGPKRQTARTAIFSSTSRDAPIVKT